MYRILEAHIQIYLNHGSQVFIFICRKSNNSIGGDQLNLQLENLQSWYFLATTMYRYLTVRSIPLVYLSRQTVRISLSRAISRVNKLQYNKCIIDKACLKYVKVKHSSERTSLPPPPTPSRYDLRRHITAKSCPGSLTYMCVTCRFKYIWTDR